MYAYPTEARAEAGGEWIGMVGEIGDGDLPVEPEIQTRLGTGESPTAVEEAIYDDLKKQLAAAAMRDPDFDESAVMQAVASEHNVTVDELDAVQIKVMVYRHGR